MFGKAITNGLNPLAGIWAREELINPDDLPAGLHALDVQRQSDGHRRRARGHEDDGRDRLRSHGHGEGRLLARGPARSCKRRHKIVGDVDGLGLALRMEICEPHDSFTPSKAIVDRMVDEALKGDLEVDGRKYGLVLDIGGYYKNVVTLAPSLHITKDEMDLALKLLDRVLHRVSKAEVQLRANGTPGTTAAAFGVRPECEPDLHRPTRRSDAGRDA